MQGNGSLDGSFTLFNYLNFINNNSFVPPAVEQRHGNELKKYKLVRRKTEIDAKVRTNGADRTKV